MNPWDEVVCGTCERAVPSPLTWTLFALVPIGGAS